MKTPATMFGARGAYAQKLASPEWERFAQHVRTSKGMACECCKQRGKPLQVHHLFYEPDREPWEYELAEVVLLCSSCRGQMHEHLSNFRKFVFRKLSPQAFRVLNGALAVGLEHSDPLVFAYAMASLAASPGSVKRFADDWQSPAIRPVPNAPSPPPAHDPPKRDAIYRGEALVQRFAKMREEVG